MGLGFRVRTSHLARIPLVCQAKLENFSLIADAEASADIRRRVFCGSASTVAPGRNIPFESLGGYANLDRNNSLFTFFTATAEQLSMGEATVLGV